MDVSSTRLVKVEQNLAYARQILAHPHNLQSEEWLLLATLVGEADLAVQEEQRANPAVDVPQLEEVIKDLREATADFTDRGFLRASGPARRKNKKLFSGSS